MSIRKSFSVLLAATMAAVSVAGCVPVAGAWAISNSPEVSSGEGVPATSPELEWVRIKGWNEMAEAMTAPRNHHDMGYHGMTGGETFKLEAELNDEGIEAELSFELLDSEAYFAAGSAVVAISEDGKTMTAKGVGEVVVKVTATANGQTVDASGYVQVAPAIYDVTYGGGAKYSGDNLVQKINAEMGKYCYASFYRQEDMDAFFDKYGYAGDWGEDVWAIYDGIVENVVDPANYEVSSGSTVITLLDSWLGTLESGTYHITYVFNDGYAATDFIVSRPKNEVEITSKAVAEMTTSNSGAGVKVANTGVMTAPAEEGVKSSLGAVIVVATSAVIASLVVFTKRRVCK